MACSGRDGGQAEGAQHLVRGAYRRGDDRLAEKLFRLLDGTEGRHLDAGRQDDGVRVGVLQGAGDAGQLRGIVRGDVQVVGISSAA